MMELSLQADDDAYFSDGGLWRPNGLLESTPLTVPHQPQRRSEPVQRPTQDKSSPANGAPCSTSARCERSEAPPPTASQKIDIHLMNRVPTAAAVLPTLKATSNTQSSGAHTAVSVISERLAFVQREIQELSALQQRLLEDEHRLLARAASPQ